MSLPHGILNIHRMDFQDDATRRLAHSSTAAGIKFSESANRKIRGFRVACWRRGQGWRAAGYFNRRGGNGEGTKSRFRTRGDAMCCVIQLPRHPRRQRNGKWKRFQRLQLRGDEGLIYTLYQSFLLFIPSVVILSYTKYRVNIIIFSTFLASTEHYFIHRRPLFYA